MTTVKIPQLNENWEMPVELKQSLYKYLFNYLFEDCSKINPLVYEEWYKQLSEEEQETIQKIKPL